VELTNAGGGSMKIARQGANNPLSIHINMDEFWSPQAMRAMSAALGLQIEGGLLGMFKGDSVKATVGTGKTSLLVDKGFEKGDSVELTNAGGGSMKIARQGANNPLSIHINMDEFY
jgi:hypothetical protein